MIDLPLALDTAIRAAKAGGDIAMREWTKAKTDRHLHITTKSSPRDLVTQADTMAQEAIIALIHAQFPEHRFLAEEEGADAIGQPDCPYRWIIDPIDGTTNFIHGKSDFATLIALEENGQTIVGVMWFPATNQLLSGSRGGGAFLNGKQVHVRETTNMDDAILVINLYPDPMTDAESFDATLPRCGSIVNYGSAGYALATVVIGENDGAVLKGAKAWDVAAGCLLIQEAGGRAFWRYQDPADERQTVIYIASSPAIYETLCDFYLQGKDARYREDD